MSKTFVEIGAGKGLGNAVAKKFAVNGYHVVLMARDRAHLEAYQEAFRQEGYAADIQITDVSDPQAFQADLEALKAQYDDIDTVHYNVGVVDADKDFTIDAALMAKRYQTDVIGAFQVMQAFATEALAQKRGSILVTGGGFALYPMTAFLPLSMDKAALRALVLAEHNEWKEKGLFIGTITVAGLIGSAGYEPDTLAEKFWKLHQDRNDAEIVY